MEKELRRLNRRELLEMLIEQKRENDRLSAELESVKGQLNERRISVENSGTLAEAMIAVNGLFNTADSIAEQYISEITERRSTVEQECNQMIAEAEMKAADIMRKAGRLAEAMIAVNELFNATGMISERNVNEAIKLKAEVNEDCLGLIDEAGKFA